MRVSIPKLIADMAMADTRAREEQEREDSKRDIVHTALDVAGSIPVIGEAADVANAGLYAARGKYMEATISIAAAVGIGEALKYVRLGKKFMQVHHVIPNQVYKIYKTELKAMGGARMR